MKRLLSFLLATCMLAAIVCTVLPAASAATVTSVELYLNEPQFGMSVNDAFLYCTNSDPEIDVSVSWFAEGADPWTDEPLTDGTFGAGTYTLFVMAGGLPPMAMQDLKEVTLNDEVVTDWCFTDDLCNDLWFMVTYTLESKEMISTANLTLIEPRAGGNIADSMLQAPADAPYYASSYWYDVTANQSVSSGTFQEGHTYQLILGVYPKDGYAMDEHTRMYVNGEEDIYYYLELNTMTLNGFAEFTIRGPVQPGDVNGDGAITGEDALFLLRYVLFPHRYVLATEGDVDADGLVTDDDAYYLLRHALFPTLYPLA